MQAELAERLQTNGADAIMEMMNQIPSEWQVRTLARAFECLNGCLPPYWQLNVPINGGAIMRQLHEVHASQVFDAGAFNADPHAGNIIVSKAGTLSLIDFGQLISISEEHRMLFAWCLIALETEDAELASHAMARFGMRNVWLGFPGQPGYPLHEPVPVRIALSILRLHFGGLVGAMNCMQNLRFASLAGM